jgi:hypothetical protein
MDPAFASSEFDIFATKPIHNEINVTYEVVYKPLAPIDQSDLTFLIPVDLCGRFVIAFDKQWCRAYITL